MRRQLFSQRQRRQQYIRGGNPNPINPSRKLTAAQVLEIRRLGSLGLSSKAIGLQFDITQGNARRIIIGSTWREIIPSQNV